MELLVALVAMTLVVGAVVLFEVQRRGRNQWDQTEALQALRRLAGRRDDSVTGNDDSGSASQ